VVRVSSSKPRAPLYLVPVGLEPRDRALEPLRERHARFVPDKPAGFLRRGEQARFGVPRALRRPGDAGGVAGQCVDRLGQLADADLDGRGEVELLPHRLRHGSGAQQAVDEVVDVGEVAGGRTVAGDRKRCAAERPVDEVRDDVAVAAGDFAGTVGVEEARFDDGQAVVVVEEVAVELAEHLGDLVRRREVQRHVLFRQRERGLAAVP
jgi:hypothetical protein